MRFGCAHMESLVSPLPWRERVLKWVTSDFWFCLFLCPASSASSQSRCGVGSCLLKKVPTRTGPRCAPSACHPC